MDTKHHNSTLFILELTWGGGVRTGQVKGDIKIWKISSKVQDILLDQVAKYDISAKQGLQPQPGYLRKGK